MKKIFKQSLMAMLMATVFFSMNVPTVLAEEPPSYHSRIMFAIGETANPPGSDLAGTYNSQYSDQGTKGDEFGDPQNAKDEGYQYEAFQRELSAGRLGDSRNFAEYMYTRGVKWNTRSITFAPDAVSNFSFVQTVGHIDYERYDLNARILQYKQDCRDEFTAYWNENKDRIVTEFLKRAYPVKSIYISYNNESAAQVSAKFGGTWQMLDDRFLWADGSATTYTWTGGSGSLTLDATGGYASVKLETTQIPSHTHSRGSHTHSHKHKSKNLQSGGGWRVRSNSAGAKYTTAAGGSALNAYGASQAHNNLPTYIRVRIFRRTA